MPPNALCRLDPKAHRHVKLATQSPIIELFAAVEQRLYPCMHEHFHLEQLTLKRETSRTCAVARSGGYQYVAETGSDSAIRVESYSMYEHADKFPTPGGP